MPSHITGDAVDLFRAVLSAFSGPRTGLPATALPGRGTGQSTPNPLRTAVGRQGFAPLAEKWWN